MGPRLRGNSVAERRAPWGPWERSCTNSTRGLLHRIGAPSLPSVDYSKIITIEPGKRGGKACIRGLRITVYDVLAYLAGGMSEDQILADFPDLQRDDIRACLAFAADSERRLMGKTA